MSWSIVSDLVKWFDDSKTEAYKQSLKDTNDVINVFWSFNQSINAIDIELIKDFSICVDSEPKALAIMFCRSILNIERIHYLQRYGIAKKDVEDIKNSNKPFETAFEKLKIYEGAYNKIKEIG